MVKNLFLSGFLPSVLRFCDFDLAALELVGAVNLLIRSLSPPFAVNFEGEVGLFPRNSSCLGDLEFFRCTKTSFQGDLDRDRDLDLDVDASIDLGLSSVLLLNNGFLTGDNDLYLPMALQIPLGSTVSLVTSLGL